MTLDEILDEIKDADNIVVMAHEAPDGDAIGSCLAMCLALRNMGKNAIVLMKDFPENFSYLPGREYIKIESEIKKYDMAIVLDCPNIKRVNPEYIPYFEDSTVKVEIDHHTKNDMFADYNIVNHVSPATCQILVSSFQYLGIEITKDIAICLLTGVITDTNGFRNSNVTVETFEFASWILEKGINLSKIYKQAMLTMSKSKFEAQKLAMNRMEFFADGKISFTYMTTADDEALGLKAGEHDGIVEIGQSIEGVEVSIFLYEKKDKKYKASLRSNEYVNVSEVCSTFGGGGHIKASGATMNMSFEEAKSAIIAEVKKHLK
jgi:phosphoesterase RecJ-like protein